MVDKRFYDISDPIKLSDLAKKIDCELVGNDKLIYGVASLEKVTNNEVTVYNNKKYSHLLDNINAAACIAKAEECNNLPEVVALLNSNNPYYAYAKAINYLYKAKICALSDDNISSEAKIGKNSNIHHTAIIDDGVEIGENANIGPYVVVGRGVKIGNNARIDSHVSIHYSIIGDDVVILNGARIGQDGFGFATEKGRHIKVFHVGRVVVGNDVEIGANTTIDRGSLQDTIIENNVRIDNLVQVGHNVFIGKGSIIVAQVGIAGSSKIGSYCALGGQVGVSGHVNIADQVQIAGQGGVIKDINDKGVVLGGTPAMPIRDWHKQSIFLKRAIRK